MQNPMPQRLHGPDEGIIIFYCGPSEDQANVMEYGRNILNNMNYPRDTFYYKSDKPHLINHHKPYKHMYYINTQQHYSGINTSVNHQFKFNSFGHSNGAFTSGAFSSPLSADHSFLNFNQYNNQIFNGFGFQFDSFMPQYF